MKIYVSITHDLKKLLCECQDAIDNGLLETMVPIKQTSGVIEPVPFADAMINLLEREQQMSWDSFNHIEILNDTLNLCKTAKILSNEPMATLRIETSLNIFNGIYEMTNLIHTYIKVGEDQ